MRVIRAVLLVAGNVVCAKGGTHGTREDKETGGDAEAAAREGGHAAADV